LTKLGAAPALPTEIEQALGLPSQHDVQRAVREMERALPGVSEPAKKPNHHATTLALTPYVIPPRCTRSLGIKR
jgi:hypothetical protein